MFDRFFGKRPRTAAATERQPVHSIAPLRPAEMVKQPFREGAFSPILFIGDRRVVFTWKGRVAGAVRIPGTTVANSGFVLSAKRNAVGRLIPADRLDHGGRLETLAGSPTYDAIARELAGMPDLQMTEEALTEPHAEILFPVEGFTENTLVVPVSKLERA